MDYLLNYVDHGVNKKFRQEICFLFFLSISSIKILGSGKTQFCLHLTAQCCLMGLRSIYIDTERTFSSIRLLNMIGDFNSKYEHLLELVRTESVFDANSLMNVLASIENELEEELNNNRTDQCPVLLIVDSIAAPLRMSTIGYNRENTLLLFTDYAKRLATRYNLLILGKLKNFNSKNFFLQTKIFCLLYVSVTNQVTTKRRSNALVENNNENSSLITNKNIENEFYMSVALGKTWSYSVNVRLAISYQGDTCRQLIVGKSIELPCYTIGFRIVANGLEELEDNSKMNNEKQPSEKRSIPPLIQADEMHLMGKQLRF